MMRVRVVNQSDRRDLWEWRNDPATRTASLSTDSVGWAEHNEWFDRIVADPSKAVYVGEISDPHVEKLGMCRFDLDSNDKSAEISININPQHRGKRLSATLLSAAIQAFHTDFEAVTELRALIRESNVASQKLFVGVGFRRSVDSADGVGSYLLALET